MVTELRQPPLSGTEPPQADSCLSFRDLMSLVLSIESGTREVLHKSLLTDQNEE